MDSKKSSFNALATASNTSVERTADAAAHLENR